MSDLFSMSLRDVLRLSASSEPTPGGGSVSAICAAFAASMAAMVSNLTIGKKRYKDVEEQVLDIRDRALCLLSRFEELVVADMAQFERFMEAYRMPKSTEEEQERRELLIQEALKGATETPMEIARTCLGLLEMVCKLAPIGNKMAISDAGVAAYLAEAALNAALLSVDINVPLIKDSKYAEKVRQEREGLVKQASELKERAISIVSSRMAGVS
ncbi:MAG TPA: cyclodeaminase/cyclohydrolase family protein [Firmicutes bacterium]|nr:cyclodeaminase/cyclohydrolase family protein [Candidatus Fermentithermobacillaceae bacterium]